MAKVLANRLKLVIGSIIGPEQTTYIQNRSILDGPLIISEVLAWAKKANKKAMFFKIDFEKAFDSISWKFLDEIMQQMHFGAKWRS